LLLPSRDGQFDGSEQSMMPVTTTVLHQRALILSRVYTVQRRRKELPKDDKFDMNIADLNAHGQELALHLP